MSDTTAIKWLLLEGNPIVRYRTVTELVEDPSNYDVEKLRAELLASETVQYWLQCLARKKDIGCIHGSFDTCFENAMGKLIFFGLRAGIDCFDEKTSVFLQWLREYRKRSQKTVLSTFYQVIVASFLALAGYSREKIVREIVLKRLQTIYNFKKKQNYSIYVDKDTYRGIPIAYKKSPLVNPRLYPHGGFQLPWIHDINAFTIFADMIDYTAKLDAIMEYIVDDRYQAFPDGYGTIMNEPNHYYAMGWSVVLPGYEGYNMTPFETGYFIQRIEMMSHFTSVRSHTWFVNSLRHLESFKTKRGTYLFPASYLKEKKNSYFITGAHMGLGEDRHKKLAYEIESTFWMLKIKKVLATSQKEV
jgi:hypothetical protein